MSSITTKAPEREFPDRSNPIFVKELRSALRGRYFRILFPLTLLLAVLIAVLVIVDTNEWNQDRMGRNLFQAMFGCLLAAVTGLVPFSAFLSMANEWDENTYDLLVLSKLKPLQVAVGKLLSAGIEALLYFSAFTPLLVFSFLLRGVDITSVLVLVGGAMVMGASTCAIALLFSSLGKHRLVRVLLMAVLAGVLLLANIAANAYADSHLGDAPTMSTVEEWQVLALTYFLVALPGILALAAAASGLAHAEENASTAPRVLVTGLAFGLLAIAAWTQFVAPSRLLPMIVGMFGITGIALCDLFFVTEAEPLSRRVRLFVPAGRLRAALASPFLPGGGRGFLLFLLHAAICIAFVSALSLLRGGAGTHRFTAGNLVLCVTTYSAFLVVYLGLPSLLFSARSRDARARILARVLIPIGALLSVFLPSLVGFLIENRDWMNLRHPFNPVWVAIESGIEGEDALHWAVLALVVAGVVIALNAFRIVRGVSEAAAAGAERERTERVTSVPRGAADAA